MKVNYDIYIYIYIEKKVNIPKTVTSLNEKM